ncbi:hypothetical protein [Streptomyces sp. NPDC002825]|uniref:hypothetical protein n=1 Tax=Streptomyces sp. NPDC002825 TaxID=3154666 RepID=UPI00332EB426
MLVRAYVLFEVESGAADVLDRLTHRSLNNCKVVARQLYPNEIVAGLAADGSEADAMNNFNSALSELMSEAGVRRATTLGVAITP